MNLRHGLGLSVLLSSTTTIATAQTTTTHDNDDRSSWVNFQTGIDYGSTFAGGMVFDRDQNRVFVTGGTYARGFFEPEASAFEIQQHINSDCFYVGIHLPSSHNTTTAASTPSSGPSWENPTRLGYVQDPEACSTAHYIPNNERLFFGASASGASIGTTDIEGDVLPQRDDVSLFGEVISVSFEHLYGRAPVLPQHYLFGGHGLFQSEVNYPFAITSAPLHRNATSEEASEEPIYVASLYSKYIGEWSEDDAATEVDLSNPYLNGNVWGIAIQKINTNPSDATDRASILDNPTHMSRAWKKNMETTYFQKLRAASMVYVNDRLLLAGSTYDFGFAFAGDDRKNRTYQDFDGFLVKFNPDTGGIPQSGTGERMMKRFESEGETDDILHGMCLHPADAADGTVKYVYVVGSIAPKNEDFDAVLPNSTIEVDGSAYIAMVDLFSMETVWEAKLEKNSATATDCVVTDDASHLYVAGNIGAGWSLPTQESNGGSDVWVRKYNLDNMQTGTTTQLYEWERQIGSDKDETLAKGGALVLDNDQNAILYGNTRGSVGRIRSDSLDRPDATNDIFILTISKDGEYAAPNPEPVFQIAESYFGQKPKRHHTIILIMTFLMLVFYCTMMGKELQWKQVGSLQPLSLSKLYHDATDGLLRSSSKMKDDSGRSGTSLDSRDDGSISTKYTDNPQQARIFV